MPRTEWGAWKYLDKPYTNALAYFTEALVMEDIM
jgi:hypothetical protein